MFANVWNSADFRLIYGFMDTYFNRNFVNQYAVADPDTKTVLATMKMNGFESFSKFLYIQLILVPDTTMRIKHTELVFDSKTSLNVIKCQLQICGTDIYETPELIQKLYLSSAFPLTTTTSTTSTINTNIIPTLNSNKLGNKKQCVCESELTTTVIDDTKVTYFINTIENLTKRTLKLLEKPHSYSTHGELTMYLDENNMVSVFYAALILNCSLLLFLILF
jgi:hypothetical protein